MSDSGWTGGYVREYHSVGVQGLELIINEPGMGAHSPASLRRVRPYACVAPSLHPRQTQAH